MWPPRWRTITGWLRDTSSRSRRCSIRLSFTLVSSKKKPSTQVPGGTASALAFSLPTMLRMLTNSTSNGLPTSTSFCSTSPPAWLWQSMKPGTTVMPLASNTVVFLPARLRTSPVAPTATKRSPFTANASALGERVSMV